MRLPLLLISAFCALPAFSAEPLKIRVRVAEAAPSVKVRGFDLQIFEGTGKTRAAYRDKVSEWEFHCQSHKVQTSSLILKSPVWIESPAGFLTIQKKPYREGIQIYSHGQTCEVINVVDIEKYLDGLVNSEFSAQWNKEAIAAQVVAARTYAFYQIRQAQKKPQTYFDVDATVKDQVYDGSIREHFRASQSVEKTRGLILTVGSEKSPEPIKAFYHSTCGGKTELPQFVWGKAFHGFKRSVTCPYCGASPVFRWELDLNSQEMRDALFRIGPSVEKEFHWPGDWADSLHKSHLEDIRLIQIDPQERITRLSTLWIDAGQRRIDLPITGVKFREALGSVRVKSTRFQVVGHGAGIEKRWQISGRGNGHGVGMCQWGAKMMGEKGQKMATILKFYYPDAIPRKLW